MSGRELFWIAVGDVHEEIGNLGLIPGIEEAEGIIVSGDLTNRGRRPKAQELMDTILSYNPTVYAQIGNMDHAEVGEYLDQGGWNIHARGLELERNIGLMGVGYSTPTPFGTPSEVGDKQIGLWLEQAFAKVRGLPQLILVSHEPPYGTTTDRLSNGQHVGSKAVREFIERVQPDVCVTGHIHEARAEDRIGKTVVVNPGMLSRGGYVLIRLAGGVLSAELKSIDR